VYRENIRNSLFCKQQSNILTSERSLPYASGYAQSAILSPVKNIDFYMNVGTGFHSNDARDVIIAHQINNIVHMRQMQ